MTQPASAHYLHDAEQHLSARCLRSALIQPLWSGYGECFRAWFEGYPTPLVVKAVQPPDTASHPRGWDHEDAHHRKCHSFKIERIFYQLYQPRLPDTCKTPALVTSSENHKDGRLSALMLIMDDLDAQGFYRREQTLTPEACRPVLNWLAHFHAHWLQDSADNLWQTGCYWHLATRHKEWQAMPAGNLKMQASAIDKMLADCPYQTVLHGDAKVANFCFNDSLSDCAAVDFQYTGKGPGIKDVAYFLGSALSLQDQMDATTFCLDIYFAALDKALSNGPFAPQRKHIIAAWRSLYPFACADFHRFLSGWSPGHHKINPALEQQTHVALSMLANS